MTSSVYDFTVRDLHDNDFCLAKYDNNQVLLVVNIATNDDTSDKQFLELKDLKQKFCDDVTILFFPCCQFGEPMAERESSEIYCWCKFEGIEFADVFAMVDVKGKNIHPLYQYLTTEKHGEISENFTKFLVDKRGTVVERFSAKDSINNISESMKLLM